MLIIPTGTDAPIYHWPAATVGLMVLNVAILILVPPPSRSAPVEVENADGTISVVVPSDDSLFDRYALTLGDGLHPVQWVTHNFLHYGWFHLVGNLIFLWAFGLVVEGKLGILRYLAIYLAIGTLHGAATQLVMLRSETVMHAAGASAVIFGLLAICMVWAPMNEVSCTWIITFGFRVIVKQFELSYVWFALLYVGEQILNLVLGGLTGRAVLSELGHLSGAFWGLAAGLAMLRLGWVDCEGWDVLTLWTKRRKLSKDWKRREARLDRVKRAERGPRAHAEPLIRADEKTDAEKAEAAAGKVRKLIALGDFPAAASAYDRFARTLPAWPDGPALLALIKEMHALGGEAASLPLMRDYCRKFPASSARMRLKIAQVLIRDRQKPVGALRTLEEIPPGALPENLEAARVRLVAQAERMLDEGVLELEGED